MLCIKNSSCQSSEKRSSKICHFELETESMAVAGSRRGGGELVSEVPSASYRLELPQRNTVAFTFLIEILLTKKD
jgi:hypothetical protein